MAKEEPYAVEFNVGICMYRVVEAMFLLRGELACLRDLPNICGDYYRQTPEGGRRNTDLSGVWEPHNGGLIRHIMGIGYADCSNLLGVENSSTVF